MCKKRFLCIIISILMVLTVLPFGVSAAGVQSSEASSDEAVSIESVEKRTIYFCNNKEWENVYLYGFYGETGSDVTGTTLGEYPGTKMIPKEINSFGQTIYSLEIPADVDYIKFSDGTEKNNRTGNIPNADFEDNTLFVLENKEIKYWTYSTYKYEPDDDNTEISTGGKVYFKANSQWKRVHAFAYDGDDYLLGRWPGKACKNEGNNIWSLELPCEPEYIIFHAYGYEARTISIPFIGYDKTAVLTGEWIKDEYNQTLADATFESYVPDIDENDVGGKLYFEDSRGWGYIHAFTYNDTTGEISLGAWPGTLCTYEGNNIWSIEVPNKPEGILFCSVGLNNRSNNQTNEIPFTGFGKTAVLTGTGGGNRWDAKFVDEVVNNKKGLCVDGTVYDVNVGDTVTYEVWVEAEELFEDVQATVYYDSTKLETEAVDYASYEGEGTNCPNLKYIVFNSHNKGVVKFNALHVKGMDFTDGKVLLTLDFKVKDNDYSEIKFEFEEMTIMGDGSRSYFTEGKPSVTDGITVTQKIEKKEEIVDIPETGLCVDGTVYDVNVDDTVTYEVWVEAEELFEDVQANVYYDSTKLETEAVAYASYEGEGTNCPNLKYIVFNSHNKGVVKFNALHVNGMDFTDGKVLLTLDFKVKDNSYSEIKFEFEEMSIMGDGSRSYFTGGKPSVTDGITVTQKIEKKGEIVDIPETGLCVDGEVYDVNVGDKVTYEAWVTAEKAFENIQAMVNYDAEKLEYTTVKGTEACPNLVNGLMYNGKIPGCVKFNASYIEGFDFTEGKVLVHMEFVVKDNSYSEINLDIEEMTIAGYNAGSYFEDGKPAVTDGITITHVIKSESIAPKAEVCVDGVVYNVQVGDIITYEVWVEAAELIENCQTTVSYDSSKLKTDARYDNNCPNLIGLVYNSKLDGAVKLVASYYPGMDFRDGKVLLTQEFKVMDYGYSEIKLDIEEMGIVGDGTRSYFEDGKAVITDGITVTQGLKCNENSVVEYAVAYRLGDANCDNKINIKDSTAIQKATAGHTTLGETEGYAADVDNNNKVNVRDATVIQKDAAGLEVEYQIGTEKEYFKAYE